MGILGLLFLAAVIFVLGKNLVLVPLWLAATSLAGALNSPGRFLSIAGNRRLRQNHAVEHATLNVMEEKLGRGERRLAVHDRCGTSIAAANLVSSLALLAVLLGLGRLSLINVVVAMLLANLSGPLLGRVFQRLLTTSARVDDVCIIGFQFAVAQPGWAFFLVNPVQAGVAVVCFVRTAAPRLSEAVP